MALTYEPIVSYTFPSNAASYTFTSISQAYDDLVVHSSFATSANNSVIYARMGNGSANTGSVYSFVRLFNGGGGGSPYTGVTTGIQIVSNTGPDISYGNASMFHIFNYSQSTYFKTTISRAVDSYNGGTDYVGGTFASTEAINTIQVLPNTGNILAGSVFTIYGVKRA